MFITLFLCVCFVLYEELTALLNIGNDIASPADSLHAIMADYPDRNPSWSLTHPTSDWPPKRAYCKHTKSGPRFTCDSNGEVCHLHEVNSMTSCCQENPNMHNQSNPSRRYTCKSCNTTFHCCTEYESCVSCCLRPEYLQRSRDLLLREKHPTLRGVDDFTWCSFKCHTSSMSLLPSENGFRSDKKHCFLDSSPPIEKQSVNSDRSAKVIEKVSK